jgi:hypothetical protein
MAFPLRGRGGPATPLLCAALTLTRQGEETMKLYVKALNENEVLVTCGFCLKKYLFSDDWPQCPECGFTQPFDPDPSALILVIPPE